MVKSSLITIFVLLFLAAVVHAEKIIDYKKIFAQAGWGTSESFLGWAKPLSMVSHKNKKCSQETNTRLTDSNHKVVFCEHIATVEEDGKAQKAALVYSIREKTPAPSSEYDCDSGISYLEKDGVIMENSAGACSYIQNIANPSDKPAMVFRVKSTGVIGMIVSNHGLECSNRWVVLQEQNSLRRVHLISSRCMR